MGATVVALEADASAAASATSRLAGQADKVTVVTAPLHAGAAAKAPYDVVLIEGGVEDVPPALVAQLAEGGRIGAVFMKGALGTVRIGLKSDGAVNWRFAFNATAPVMPGFAATQEFVL